MKTSLTPFEHAKVLWGTLLSIPSIVRTVFANPTPDPQPMPAVEKKTLRARYAESLARVDAVKAARRAKR